MRGLGLTIAIVAACGRGAPPSGATAATAARASSTAALPTWIGGAWISSDGRAAEHWHSAGGAMFGVGFPANVSPSSGVPFEVMIVTERGDKLRFQAWPGGDGGVAFDEIDRGASHVVFANPAHDFPREVAYRRTGDELVAHVGPGGGERSVEFRWRRGEGTSAPALEDADLRFAADTANDLSAGWASWFDPEGAQWRSERGRIQGRDAIRELMRPTFDERGTKLEWIPRASGFSPRGDLGFTIGDYVATPRTGEPSRGGYVTIWRRQSDGSWMVLFDVGT